MATVFQAARRLKPGTYIIAALEHNPEVKLTLWEGVTRMGELHL
jgi:hypothetical protein